MHRTSYDLAIIERHKEDYRKIIQHDDENFYKLQNIKKMLDNSESIPSKEQEFLNNLGIDFIEGKIGSNLNQIKYEKSRLDEQVIQRNIDFLQSKIDNLEKETKDYQNILDNKL